MRPSRPAFREKHLGIWQTWSWREVDHEVRALMAKPSMILLVGYILGNGRVAMEGAADEPVANEDVKTV